MQQVAKHNGPNMADSMTTLYRSVSAFAALMLLLIAVVGFSMPATTALLIAVAWFFTAVLLIPFNGRQPVLLARARIPLLLMDVTAVAAIMVLGGVVSSVLFVLFPLYSLHIWQHFEHKQRLVASLLLSTGFVAVALFSPYWSEMPGISLGILLGILWPLLSSLLHAVSRRKSLFAAGNETFGQITEEKPLTCEAVSSAVNDAPYKRPARIQNPIVSRILLLSRDRSDRYNILQYLHEWSSACDVVHSCQEALNRVAERQQKHQSYKMILVDKAHIDMNLVQFASQLRAISSATGALANPLVLMAASSHLLDKQSLLQAGYIDFLDLPPAKTLLFNLVKGSLQPPQRQDKVIHLLSRSRPATPSRSGIDILLACSRQSVCGAARQALEAVGHKVYDVEDGSRALAALSEHYFDLAIVDENLSDMSATDLAGLFRATQVDRFDMPLILLSDKQLEQGAAVQHNSNFDARLCASPLDDAQLLELTQQLSLNRLAQEQSSPLTSAQERQNYVTHNHQQFKLLDGQQLNDLLSLSARPEFMQALAEEFDLDMQAGIEMMSSSLQNQDFSMFRDAAQLIKASAASLGASLLYELGACGCRYSKKDFSSGGKGLLLEIRNSFTATLALLKKQLQEEAGHSRL